MQLALELSPVGLGLRLGLVLWGGCRHGGWGCSRLPFSSGLLLSLQYANPFPEFAVVLLQFVHLLNQCCDGHSIARTGPLR